MLLLFLTRLKSRIILSLVFIQYLLFVHRNSCSIINSFTKFSHNPFLGILVGTDFNPGGIKGIGPKKALKLIQSEKPFETIFEELKPDFDWKEIFDLFKNMPVTDDYSMEFNDIDEDKVKEILVEKHDFSVERVENTLNKINEDKAKGQTSLAAFG